LQWLETPDVRSGKKHGGLIPAAVWKMAERREDRIKEK
jgi:hypothetical protein